LTGTMTGSGTLVLGSSPMTLRFNGTAGDGNAIFNFGSGTAVANVRSTGTAAIALGGLAGGPGTQLQGDNSSGGANLTYTIGGAGVNTEFDGVIRDGTVGTVALVKTGAGVFTLAGTNIYSAGTIINGGTLLLNNTNGSGTGSGIVTVANGGTLGGTGVISGAVTVNSGGMLAPGNPLGILTVSNNLTFAAGSTTFMQVQHSPLTNDAVKVTGTLAEGGMLNITNIGASALAAGDSFVLFNAAGYSGAFANLILPPLPVGLAWNTNALYTAGTVSVVITARPAIGSIVISGNSLVFSGTGGVGNANYYLLGTTNLAAPLTNWPRLLTNQFDAAGNFNFTNGINSTSQQSFYLLQLQ